MTLLAHKLVRIIETHADAMTVALEERIAACDRCSDYHKVSSEELKRLVGGIYRELGQWLISKTEAEIEQRYFAIGVRRAEQGVAVSQLLWCIVLVKENLWDYLRRNEILESASQVFGEMELLQLVEQFFRSRHLLRRSRA